MPQHRHRRRLSRRPTCPIQTVRHRCARLPSMSFRPTNDASAVNAERRSPGACCRKGASPGGEMCRLTGGRAPSGAPASAVAARRRTAARSRSSVHRRSPSRRASLQNRPLLLRRHLFPSVLLPRSRRLCRNGCPPAVPHRLRQRTPATVARPFTRARSCRRRSSHGAVPSRRYRRRRVVGAAPSEGAPALTRGSGCSTQGCCCSPLQSSPSPTSPSPAERV